MSIPMNGFGGLASVSDGPFTGELFEDLPFGVLGVFGVDGGRDSRWARKLGRLADFRILDADSTSVGNVLRLALAEEVDVSIPESLLVSSCVWGRVGGAICL